MKNLIILIIIAFALWGCGFNAPKLAMSEDEIEAEFNKRLTPEERKLVEIPYRIPDSVIHTIQAETQYLQNDQKLDYLVRNMIMYNRFHLEYAEDSTFTATKLLTKKRGNCISFSHLLIALSRAAGLPSHYVYILKNPSFSVYEKTISVNYHVMTGIEIQDEIRFYDFQPGYNRSFFRLYGVSDLEAIALHYNNIGAEYITRDNLKMAEKYLTIAYKLAPENSEILSNYGLLAMRKNQPQVAKKYLWRAVNLDQTCYPAWHNLLYLSVVEKDQNTFMALKKELKSVESPTIKVFLASLAYREKNYSHTIDLLDGIDPERTRLNIVYLLRAQAYYQMGNIEASREMLNRYRKTGGNDDLQADFLKLELDKLEKH